MPLTASAIRRPTTTADGVGGGGGLPFLWPRRSTSAARNANYSNHGSTTHLFIILAVALALLVLLFAAFVVVVVVLQRRARSQPHHGIVDLRYTTTTTTTAAEEEEGPRRAWWGGGSDAAGDELQHTRIHELLATAAGGVDTSELIDSFILGSLCLLDQEVVGQMTAEERATWLRHQRRSLLREYQQRTHRSHGPYHPHPGGSLYAERRMLQREEVEPAMGPQALPVAQPYESPRSLPRVVDGSVVVHSRHVDHVFARRKANPASGPPAALWEKQTLKRHLRGAVCGAPELGTGRDTPLIYEARCGTGPVGPGAAAVPAADRMFRMVHTVSDPSDPDGYRLFRRLSPERLYGWGSAYLQRPPEAPARGATATHVSLRRITSLVETSHSRTSPRHDTSRSSSSSRSGGGGGSGVDPSASLLAEVDVPSPMRWTSSRRSSSPAPPSPSATQDDEARAA